MLVVGLFLDMSKAFDLVCHKTLISKLERYGIRGRALELLASYLSDRKQCVEITQKSKVHCNTYRSSFKQQNPFGVPQGSILGPLLFLIYINDLPQHINYQCILYADDTTTIIKSKNISDLQKEINNALTNTVEWLNLNNLSVNFQKTKYVQFLTYNSIPSNLQISFNSQNIERVDNIQFLGLNFDTHLNWKVHIDNLCGKLDRFIYVLKRLSRNSSQKIALTAYHGHVASLIQYGLILWGNSVNANKIFIKQKACLRSICGANILDSCKPLFKKHNILPLPSQYIFEMILFVKKYPDLFQLYLNLRSRRDHKIQLQVPKRRIKIFSKSAYCMAIAIYNKLPDILKKAPLTPKFKRNLKMLLINKMYYNINEYMTDKEL